MTPTKDIITHSIALTPSNGVPGLEVSFSPRGEHNDGTKAAFTPIDGVWNRDGPNELLELKPPRKRTAKALRIALDNETGRPQRSQTRFETKSIINSIDGISRVRTTKICPYL